MAQSRSPHTPPADHGAQPITACTSHCIAAGPEHQLTQQREMPREQHGRASMPQACTECNHQTTVGISSSPNSCPWPLGLVGAPEQQLVDGSLEEEPSFQEELAPQGLPCHQEQRQQQAPRGPGPPLASRGQPTPVTRGHHPPHPRAEGGQAQAARAPRAASWPAQCQCAQAELVRTPATRQPSPPPT